MSQINQESDVFTRIIQSLNITEQGAEKRKSFLDLDETDANLLKQLAEPISHAHDGIMYAFYNHLENYDTTREIIQGKEKRQRLHEKQRQYLSELFEGSYDKQYLLNRLKVGIAHQKIGLDPQWYIGAYSKYICSLLPVVLDAVDGDAEKAIATIKAFLKVVFLDIGLVLETYFEADRQSIEAVKDYAENIVCSVPAGLIVLDNNLKILSANRHLDSLYGENHNTLKGLHLKKILPEPGIVERAKEVISLDKVQTGIHATKIGHRQPLGHFDITFTPMYLEPGREALTRSAKLLVIIEDVSEQKRLREETINADSQIRAIIAHVPDGIITIDDTGTIELFNTAAEKLFGYQSTEVIGKNIKMLMLDHFSIDYDGYILRYLNSGSKNCIGKGFRELEGKRKSGASFPMDLSISEMPAGDRSKFIGVVRDISIRKQDEEKMEKLSRALEQTADAIMITDNLGVIEYVNYGFKEITGYKKSEVLNKKPNFLKSGKQDSQFYQALWDNINKGKVFREVLINKKKDGTLYYEEKTITPLLNNKNEITHFISSGKDITDRMLTQE